MFKCQITGKTSKPYEKVNRIVIETRVKVYDNWDHENEEQWNSHGTETVREINASEEGLRLWEALSPADKALFAHELKGGGR
jgi:hypothetical protein